MNKNFERTSPKDKIVTHLLDEGYTVEEILNGLWSIADEIRINYAENPETYIIQSNRNELTYYSSLSSILYLAWQEIKNLK